MGNKAGKEAPGNPVEREKSKEIDAALSKDRKLLDKEIKLLLLGAGESGKSTFLKQMKMIYGNGFTAADIYNYKDLVYTNVVRGLQDLIKVTRREEVEKKMEEATTASAEHLLALRVGHQHKFEEVDVAAVKEVWADAAVKSAWEHRSQYQVYANTDYFFNEIDRISGGEFQPTDTDILKLRMPTTGVVETVFDLESYKFRVVDVGGQRSERRKWMVCFPDVTVVVFVAAISEFDQRLYEDEKQNRLQESLHLFEETINNEFFANTPVILFLNKEDIFREKLASGKDISVCFPSYNGGCDYDIATNYIKSEFFKANHNSKREIFTRLTNATDKKNMKYVFDAVTTVILSARIQSSGML